MILPTYIFLSMVIAFLMGCGQSLEKGSSEHTTTSANAADNHRSPKVDDTLGTIGQSRQQSSGRWSRMADMHSAHQYHSAVEVEGKIYVLGGSQFPARKPSEFEQYDPATNQWTILPNLPTPRSFLAAATIQNRIYAIGGIGLPWLGDSTIAHARVEMYDLATGTWSRCTDLPTPRNRLAAVTVKDEIYVMGGMDNHGNSKVVEVYNPRENSWRHIAAMPTARHGHSAVVVNGNILVIGGYRLLPVSSVEQYDPSADRWTKMSNMPTKRGFFGAAAVQGLVYALAGRVQGDPPIERFDPVKNEWEFLGTMPGGFRNRFAIATADNIIFVLGGEFQGDRETIFSVLAYDIGHSQ